MLNKAPLKVNNLKELFIESLISRVDTMTDPSEMMRMHFCEFVVFVARISDQVNGAELHLKVDKLLGILFSTIGAKKDFTFDEEAKELIPNTPKR